MPKDALQMLLDDLPNELPSEVRAGAISIATERILSQRLHPGAWVKVTKVVAAAVREAWSEYQSFSQSIDAIIPGSTDGSRISDVISNSQTMPDVTHEHHRTPKKPYKRTRRYLRCANRNCGRRFLTARRGKNVKFCGRECQIESAEHRSNTRLIQANVVTDIRDGLRTKEIADRYGVSDTAVRAFVKRHKLRQPKARNEKCLDCPKLPERGFARCRLHRRLADARRQRDYKRRKHGVKQENYRVDI